MTQAELIIRAAEALGAAAEQNPWFAKQATIHLAVNYAMHELALRVARNPHQRHLLQTAYTITVTSGVADLSNATDVPAFSTYGAPLSEAICYSTLVDAYESRYTYLPHYQDLLLPQPPVFGYYNLTGQRLRIKELSSGATNASGTFTLTANFVPTVAQLRAEIEDDAVTALCDVIKRPLVTEEPRATNRSAR